MIDLTITLTRTLTAAVEFVVEFPQTVTIPYETDQLRPTDANVVFGHGGDARYVQVWGWLVRDGDEFAGRRLLEASGQSLNEAAPFVRDLVEQLRPLVGELVS